MKQSSKNKKDIKSIISLGLVIFITSYVGWVMLWSHKGDGLKRGRIGYDTCAHCGMALSDQRYVASILIKDQFDNDKTLHFDDIGCLINYTQQGEVTIIDGVVFDFYSLSPISIKNAYFEKSKNQTPMASGWISREKKGQESKRFEQISKE